MCLSSSHTWTQLGCFQQIISREGVRYALTVSRSGCDRCKLFYTRRLPISKQLAISAHEHLYDETGARTQGRWLAIQRVTDQSRFVQSDDNYQVFSGAFVYVRIRELGAHM